MNKNILIGLACLGLLTTACLLSQTPTAAPARPATQAAVDPGSQVIPTLPPALAEVEFPTAAQPYPADWPANLRLAGGFQGLDFSQGTLPGGSRAGYSQKMRYTGSLESALGALRSALAEKGWQVAEESSLDSGGKLWVATQASGGSGILIIEPEGNGKVVVLATFYP